MKFLKVALLFLLFPLLTGSTSAHKFYVSTTDIEYVAEKESLQIITKIFIDDIEQELRKRYDPSISLASKKETKADAELLKKNILQKLNISVNGKPVKMNYLGKEYDIETVKVYIEIEEVNSLNSIEVENKILMDIFPEQQNIIHLKTSSRRKSLILDIDNPKGLLKFN